MGIDGIDDVGTTLARHRNRSAAQGMHHRLKRDLALPPKVEDIDDVHGTRCSCCEGCLGDVAHADTE